MSVDRQENWQSQQRVDVPHLRSVESSICGDFDLLAGTMIAGQAPLVINGFKLVTAGITLAANLQLAVAGSTVIHYLASESGSIFGISSSRANETLNTTNARVIGSFTPGQTNYIGLDFVRSADASTVDLVEFINPNTDEETPVQTPLARTIDYRISISTLDFENSPSIAPIAIVSVDSTGAITSVQDARYIAFRLGTGGTAPNIKNSFTWPSGRAENLSGDVFSGGDKALNSFKVWMDSIMTRLWEVGGGEYWYSPTEYGNEKLCRSGSPFVSNGEYMEWTGTNIHWKGLTWTFANSTAVLNSINDQTTDSPGLTDLADGQCIYVDVDRTVNRTGGTALNAVKGPLATLGSPTIPGSRYVLAWRFGSNIFTRDQSYFVGSSFKAATIAAAGTVKISASDALPISPVWVATVDSTSFIAKAAGISRGFMPGQSTPAHADDFIGSFGNITIGGGWDGADGSGGGNPVDFSVIIQTSREQDTIYLSGVGDFFSHGIANVAIVSPYVNNAQQSGTLLAQFAVGPISGLTTVHAVYGDGSLGLVNIDDTNSSAGGLPATPAPISGFEIRSKLFTRTNQLGSPNTRDQLCWITWDGTVYVLKESNPY
jgi:hypothetical protein